MDVMDLIEKDAVLSPLQVCYVFRVLFLSAIFFWRCDAVSDCTSFTTDSVLRCILSKWPHWAVYRPLFIEIFSFTNYLLQVISILAQNPRLPLHVASTYMSNTLKVFTVVSFTALCFVTEAIILLTLLLTFCIYYTIWPTNVSILIIIHIHVPDLDGEYWRSAELRTERDDRHWSRHCEQEHGKQGTYLFSTVFPLKTVFLFVVSAHGRDSCHTHNLLYQHIPKFP